MLRRTLAATFILIFISVVNQYALSLSPSLSLLHSCVDRGGEGMLTVTRETTDVR
jgi:hypothetical protein